MINPFEYSTQAHERKHGPAGYRDYEHYRDWLRDDFCFRCAYCLRREKWAPRSGNWDIDHFIPQSVRPDLACVYENLIYSCHSCNIIKSATLTVDPCNLRLADCLKVNRDGSICALNEDGLRLIKDLRLDNADYTSYRRRWIANLEVLAVAATDLWEDQLSFPDDLPNLNRLRPPMNSLPEGVRDCFFEKRLRSELPGTY